jgi:hypothetical protein
MELCVAVSHESASPFYLLFVSVWYFAVPTHWRGANFHLIEKPDEHLSVLPALGHFDNWPEHLLRRLQIYVVATPKTEIKIVAGGVEKIDFDDKPTRPDFRLK